MSLLIMLKKLKELLKKIKSEKFMNGWLMLNKPKGFTSNYCLNVLKYSSYIRQRKINKKVPYKLGNVF